MKKQEITQEIKKDKRNIEGNKERKEIKKENMNEQLTLNYFIIYNNVYFCYLYISRPS